MLGLGLVIRAQMLISLERWPRLAVGADPQIEGQGWESRSHLIFHQEMRILRLLSRRHRHRSWICTSAYQDMWLTSESLICGGNSRLR